MAISKRILSGAMLLLLVIAAEARTIIYTSQIGGVKGLAQYSSLSDCTVFFDLEEETDYTIVLANVENAIFDGMQTALVCKSTCSESTADAGTLRSVTSMQRPRAVILPTSNV